MLNPKTFKDQTRFQGLSRARDRPRFKLIYSGEFIKQLYHPQTSKRLTISYLFSVTLPFFNGSSLKLEDLQG